MNGGVVAPRMGVGVRMSRAMDMDVVRFVSGRVWFMVFARFIVQMNVEFNSFQGGFLLASGVEVIAIKAQFFELAFENFEIDPEVRREPISISPLSPLKISR